MAEEELKTVELKEDFYKDSFNKVLLIIIGILIAILVLTVLSLYIHLNKPPPTTFKVQDDWRIQPLVPLDQPYLSTPDVLQWVTNVLSSVFVFDFVHYDNQLKSAQQYFTDNGWKVFLNHLNVYANYNNVQAYKLFVTSTPVGAPILVNSGIATGQYVWCVQMPITINYAGFKPPIEQTIDVQVRVIRVSTLDNLTGIGVENVVIAKTIDANKSGCIA